MDPKTSFAIFGKCFESLIERGVETFDKQAFSEAWEDCGPFRHQALVYLCRKSYDKYRNDGRLDEVILRISDFAFQFLGYRMIAYLFDIINMAFANVVVEDDMLIQIKIMSIAKTSRFGTDKKLTAATLGVTGMYYFNPEKIPT